MQTHTDTHRHALTETYIDTHAETHTHTYSHIHADTHSQIYTHTKTHIGTLMQMHTNTQSQACRYTQRHTLPDIDTHRSGRHTHMQRHTHAWLKTNWQHNYQTAKIIIHFSL